MEILKVEKNSLQVAIFLAFLATAGLFYVNLGAAFLSAFVDGLGISRAEAGFITSANKYGAAFGGLIATFVVKHLKWRRSAYTLILLLIAIDLLSFFLSETNTLIGIRFLHGSIGGFLVGLGFSIIAKTESPDKVFGMLVAIQYTFGSIGIFTVPKLVGFFGPGAAFGALIIFSFITACMIPFIPDYDDFSKKEKSTSHSKSLLLLPAVLSLLAIFLFQSSNMGIADYTIELGKENGYSVNYLSNVLTVANIIAVSGALLVYKVGTKFGRAKPIVIGTSIAGLFTFALHWTEIASIYFIANAITGITWAFTIPFLLGLCAALDKKGQVVVFAGFISKIGLASGPLIAAMVIGESNFNAIINLSTLGLFLCGAIALWPAKKSERLS